MSDVRVERQTTDVIGSPSEHDTPLPRVESQTVDVVAHQSIYPYARPKVERLATDVIGSPDRRGQSMSLPPQAVQNHTIALMCHMAPGSMLMLTPEDYRSGGVLVTPDAADLTQARFHYIAEGYTLTSNPFPAFGSSLMIVFRMDVDGVGATTTLRVNGTAVGVTESGAPFGTVYTRIQGALQWPVASSDTEIAELILFGSLVSNTNLLVLEEYLRDKWIGAGPVEVGGWVHDNTSGPLVLQVPPGEPGDLLIACMYSRAGFVNVTQGWVLAASEGDVADNYTQTTWAYAKTALAGDPPTVGWVIPPGSSTRKEGMVLRFRSTNRVPRVISFVGDSGEYPNPNGPLIPPLEVGASSVGVSIVSRRFASLAGDHRMFAPEGLVQDSPISDPNGLRIGVAHLTGPGQLDGSWRTEPFTDEFNDYASLSLLVGA